MKTHQLLMHLIEEVKAAHDKAITANEAKSRFLATMSHEIRTPVNGINGMTEMLFTTDLSEEQQQYASILRSSCETLLRLIRDLLDLSRIEAGKMELEHTVFDLPRLLNEIINQIRPQATARKLDLQFEFSGNLESEVIGDPTRLRQIVSNLLDNSIKFTHEGRVLLRVSCVKPDCSEILFEIIDSGIGIPTEKLAEIFDEFSQATPSTSRIYGGTGLGLAISQRLARMMGSEIKIDSQLNQGSRFFFSLCLPFSNK
ncbi:MAG: ATP-binding protein [Candidatus Rifleibacteriota bacterium]